MCLNVVNKTYLSYGDNNVLCNVVPTNVLYCFYLLYVIYSYLCFSM